MPIWPAPMTATRSTDVVSERAEWGTDRGERPRAARALLVKALKRCMADTQTVTERRRSFLGRPVKEIEQAHDPGRWDAEPRPTRIFFRDRFALFRRLDMQPEKRH